jgi:outer membrane protein TolC
MELLSAQPGGITAEQVAARAERTSFSAKAYEEALRGTAARVDEAYAAFLPRLSGIAKYTRLSNFTPPNLFGTGTGGGNNTVGTTLPPGLITQQELQQPGALVSVQTPNFSIPFFVLDNWLLQATLTIPISDYFLRIDQNYTAATRSQDAARWDVVSAKTSAAANGRLAFYNWLNYRGAVVVAVQALNDQKTHVRDARNQFAVGNASKADVLLAETKMAQAELGLERAKNLAELWEEQVRVAIHADDAEVLVPGEDLSASIGAWQGNTSQMITEALSARPEIKSAEANAEAARKQAEAAAAGRWPVLSAFGDGILGNPNPRQIPPSNVWFGTWDVGAQLTWSPNDILLANGQVNDNRARAAQIIANKGVTADGIAVEVTQDFEAVREADFSVQSSTRELASAEEGYRVQRELFNNGRGTSTTLADAEQNLTQARYDLLNAKVAARTSRVRLDHALGRDVKRAQ